MTSVSFKSREKGSSGMGRSWLEYSSQTRKKSASVVTRRMSMEKLAGRLDAEAEVVQVFLHLLHLRGFA